MSERSFAVSFRRSEKLGFCCILFQQQSNFLLLDSETL